VRGLCEIASVLQSNYNTHYPSPLSNDHAHTEEGTKSSARRDAPPAPSDTQDSTTQDSMAEYLQVQTDRNVTERARKLNVIKKRKAADILLVAPIPIMVTYRRRETLRENCMVEVKGNVKSTSAMETSFKDEECF
jgi:hypothetical protein